MILRKSLCQLSLSRVWGEGKKNYRKEKSSIGLRNKRGMTEKTDSKGGKKAQNNNQGRKGVLQEM